MRVKFKYFLLLFSLVLLASQETRAFSVDTLYICKNSCIIYSNVTTEGTPVAWQWTFQGGTPGSSNMQNPEPVCYPAAGVFLTTIKTTFDNGQDTTDSVHVVVYDHPIPAFSFPRDTGYCQGASFPLTLQAISYPGVKYRWNTGATGRSLVASSPGSYWVDLVLRAGNNVCDSIRKEVSITEYPRPSVYLGQDKLMCQNQNIVLDAGAGSGYRYLWKPNNEVSRTIQVGLPGLYEVTVSNAFGCTASDQIELKDSCPHYVFVPNAVSPNEDRLNDLFVKFWNFTPSDYTFSVFNRWGELLFETHDMNAGWDCRFNGEIVQQDIYVYKITYFDNDKKWYELRGTFYVVR